MTAQVYSLMMTMMVMVMMIIVACTCSSAQVTTFDATLYITTIAGTGVEGYNGDGILATDANLYFPRSVAVNSLGEVIISDTYNQRIRKILLNGTIATIAGTGNYGYNGDGILATDAYVYYPYGVAVNSLGEVIIADIYNNRIRKILLNGTITTIAGTGNYGYNGDGILATNAQLPYPLIVTVNSLGEVLITHSDPYKVRKILLNGTITTIAGTGNYGYNGDGILATDADLKCPYGVAVNSLGEVVIADSDNHRIRKILLNGNITTIAGTGVGGYNGDGMLATDANVNYPYGVAVNSLGEIFIADIENHRIRKILLNGNITTVAGTGVEGYNGDGILATDAQLFYPAEVTVNSLDEVLIVDQGNNRIRKLSGVCPPNSIKSGQQCNCVTGYFGYGQYCDKYNCGSIGYDRSDVCSSNGKCISPNNCKCNDGYYGTNCELYNCNNILFNDTRVCSSFGSCTGPNICTCNSGWNGTNCEIPLCDGIHSGDAHVCNGHGSCDSKDLCSCSQGWGSTFCNVPICNGTLATQTSTVCGGGHGSCSAPDICNCTNNNYGGQFCSIPKCNGILASNPSVCSNGNGVCSTVDTCVCKNGFAGHQCSLHYFNSDSLYVSFNFTQDYVLESSTTVKIVINNPQITAFYNTRSVTVRSTFTLDSGSPVVVSVVLPAISSSTLETAVPPFKAVGKVSVTVQLVDTESGIVISDNVQSTNSLSIINRSRVGSASQSSYFIGFLVCLFISLIGLF